MRIFQATYRDRTGATRRAAKWYVELRNAAGVLRRVPGFTDHKATEALGRQLVRLVNCKGSGQIPDPALVQWLEGLPGRLQTLLARQGFLDGRQSAGMKPLADHLADYGAYLAAKGNTAEYVEKSCARVRRVVNGCGLAFWSEITASKVLALLNDLRPDTAAELRAFLAGKMPGAAAFALPNRDRTIRGFKADLAAAGIDYRDDAGRVADFHSLRHTAGTLLAATGVHPKVAQSLMRHSDINLTMSRYSHVLIGQESDAVAGLPDLAAPPREALALAVGQDGA
ncbi:MAG: tyrosine-type recombinase/integrase, partial [Planctomycetota bacterium]|nr:tyrosine-type recombinase/integrase [Planctomycetota bacterium]